MHVYLPKLPVNNCMYDNKCQYIADNPVAIIGN